MTPTAAEFRDISNQSYSDGRETNIESVFADFGGRVFEVRLMTFQVIILESKSLATLKTFGYVRSGKIDSNSAAFFQEIISYP